MIPPYRVLKTVPELIFSPGATSRIPHIRASRQSSSAVFIIDHFFQDGLLDNVLQPQKNDSLFYLDTRNEPTTDIVGEFCDEIKKGEQPDLILGIGGGSAMDVAKAVSIVLTNPGHAEDYQGWDLVQQPPLYKIGVPTISGTGAEVSRTAVLTGPQKKQGINSNFSLFDYILLDPDLLTTVPARQRFFTGMDCYVHCVESLSGVFLNEFSAAFASKALELCQSVFLNDAVDSNLMVASYMGGHAVVYSEVGLVHALSYGISWAFHIHHGEANCIIFNELDEYYPQHLPEFRRMLDRFSIQLRLPKNLLYDDELIDKMADIVLLMQRPLFHALGPDWQSKLPKTKIKDFYYRLLDKS